MDRTDSCRRRLQWVLGGALGLALSVVFLDNAGQVAAQGQQIQVQVGPPGARMRIRPGRVVSDEEVIEGLFLPVDRDTTRQLFKAKALLDDSRYSDAATILDEILQRSEDCFFKPDDDQPLHRSLKAEAQRLIGSMPLEGQKAYELQFGARAQKMLAEATTTGDVAKLEEIARRFFHTQAGYEATLLLGRHHLDHGRPLAAALCFERLRDSPGAAKFEPGLSVLLATSWLRGGMSDRASEVLVALKRNLPRAEIRVADKPQRLFNEPRQAIAWLVQLVGTPRAGQALESQDWALYRGDPSRNAAAGAGLPLLNPRWRVPTTNHPALEKSLADVRSRYAEQGIAALPAMQPLAVGELVLMRTARNWLAIDLNTGKRLWPAGADAASEDSLLASTMPGPARMEFQANGALVERFWQDAAFGVIASDGERVFVIDDLGSSSAASGGRIGGRRNRRARQIADLPAAHNRLSAYELRSEGKLKWSVGGAAGDDEPQLAEAFFLGAPLPVQGKLYALAEIKGEIKLVVLDPATGRLDWSQQVAVVEQTIQQDPVRRLAGCSPSYANGVLVCPTAAGAVVAVDLTNRSLLWGYQYPRNQPAVQNVMLLRGGAVFAGQPPGAVREGWSDATVTIASGSVLVTPPESDELHCLSLLEGKPLWKPRARGDNLYVACVKQDNVVLVGKHAISALSLSSGEPVWKPESVALPDDAMPSGRGCFGGDSYYLPLTSAEVAKIDLKTGSVVGRRKSRGGDVPGNLICYRGQVISQGIDSVDAYFQVESLQQQIAAALAANPSDPWALAHRGEIALEDGRLAEAVADIRRSYQADGAPFTRDLLVEALLIVLSDDFDKYQEFVDELDGLVTFDGQRAAFLRAVADGRHRAGNVPAALDAYMKLATLESQTAELDAIDDELSVRRSAWVRARFNALLADAAAADRSEIEAAVQKQLDAARTASDTRPLRQFLDCFADHPLADDARDALAGRLTGPDTWLERERLLWQLQQSVEPARRKRALAQMGALLREAGRPDEAAEQHRQLAAAFGGEPVLDDKTPEQLVEQLPEGSPFRRALALDQHWPQGAVAVEKDGPRALSGGQNNRPFPIELRGDRRPFFEQMTVGLDQQQVIGRDTLGKERFRMPLQDVSRLPGQFAAGPITSATADGHVLVVCCAGMQVIGFDTLGAPGGNIRRALWRHDLFDPSGYAFGPGGGFGQGGVQGAVAARPWGGSRDTSRGPTAQPRNMASCTPTGLVFQRGRDVVAVDSLTGKLLWVRHGLPAGSDLFGDREFVIVAPPDDSAAFVLRAIDGHLLCKRNLPPADQRWTTYGRNLLISRSESTGQLVLALYDPIEEREVWSEAFHPSARGDLVDGDAVAMFEPSGRFVVISLADGRRAIDRKLEAEQSLLGIYVLRSAERDILVTNRTFNERVPTRHFDSPVGDTVEMVTGRVYAFDRTTGQLEWPAPATIEQHALVLNQPPELPVLTFIRNIHSTQPNQVQNRGSILCIDKRTGRLVYQDDELQQMNTFEIAGNLEEKSVTLAASAHSIKLRYTDESISPEPPFQAGIFEKAKPSGGRNKAAALLRALGLGSRAKPPANADDSRR